MTNSDAPNPTKDVFAKGVVRSNGNVVPPKPATVTKHFDDCGNEVIRHRQLAERLSKQKEHMAEYLRAHPHDVPPFVIYWF